MIAPPSHADLPQPTGPNRRQVQTFVLALDKALRAQRLYGGRSSAFVDSLLRNLEREVSDLLAQGAVRLGLCSAGFTVQGQPLWADEGEGTQVPWAFRLFCEGIREITFEQTMQWEELLDFLDILATNPRTAEEDVVTMLWERDFDGIQYFAADTFAAGLEVDENGDLIVSATTRLERDSGPGSESVALAPDDIRRLSAEGRLAWLGASRAPTRSAGGHAWQTARLKSGLQDVDDLPRFLALGVRICRTQADPRAAMALVLEQFDAYLSRHDERGLVLYLQVLATLADEGEPEVCELAERCLAPERIPALAALLAEAGGQTGPLAHQLLRTATHDALTRLLAALPACPLGRTLEGALLAQGADLTALYVERLASKDPDLVLGSIQALGRLGTEEAERALAGVLGRPSTHQRTAALRALTGRYSPTVKAALLRCLEDTQPAVRRLALAVLEEAADPGVVRALVVHMRKPEFEKLALEEAAAWYQALASAEEPSALACLSARLARRNLLRSREIMAHQVLAARCLGALGTPAALRILEEAAGSSSLPGPVRNAAHQALASHREG